MEDILSLAFNNLRISEFTLRYVNINMIQDTIPQRLRFMKSTFMEW